MFARLKLFSVGTLGAAKRASRGSTAVEMAMISPLFFMLMIGMTESALIFTAQQLLENATYNTSRLAKTGYVASGSTQPLTVQQILDNELSSYGTLIDISKLSMTSMSYTSFSAAGSGTGGTSGLGTQQQIVVYTVSYPWTLFTPMLSTVIGSHGVVNLTSQIVVRNEPYG